jgi:hypothetical protein
MSSAHQLLKLCNTGGRCVAFKPLELRLPNSPLLLLLEPLLGVLGELLMPRLRCGGCGMRGPRRALWNERSASVVCRASVVPACGPARWAHAWR